MGLYQSFLFTAVTLIVFVCILDLLNGQRAQRILCDGFRAIGMLLLSGALYYIVLKILTPVIGGQLVSGDYNSLDQITQLSFAALPQNVMNAYRDYFVRFWNAASVYPPILVKGVICLLLIFGSLSLAVCFIRKTAGLFEKILLIVLIFLIPLAANGIYVLTGGMTHDLMVYGIWLILLFVLLVTNLGTKTVKLPMAIGSRMRAAAMLLTAVLLYGNVQFANGLYLKKDMEYDAFLSIMTRITERIEQNDDYVPRVTPVVFLGSPVNLIQSMPGFSEYNTVTGAWYPNVICGSSQDRYKAYYDYVLGGTVQIADMQTWNRIVEDVDALDMTCYPDKECIQFKDGVMIIRLS